MTRRTLLLLLITGIVLASCAPGIDGQPTPDVKLTIEANAQTMVVALFQTQTALAPSATYTPLATLTSLPTATALVLASPTTGVVQPVFVAASATPTGPTPTPLLSSLASGCNNMYLIRSWTDPEGPFNPDQAFTQYWQIENTGTCDWLYVFDFQWVSGDRIGETTVVRFGKKKEPGGTTTIAVGLRAPHKSGSYKASWRMTDGGGTQFGSVLPVSITVGGPTNTPKPDTAATAAAQTVAAGVAQTFAAQTAAVAAQQTVDAAVAQTLTQAATNAAGTATAYCAQTPPATPGPVPPCQ